MLREIDDLGDNGVAAVAVNRQVSGPSQRKAEREADTAQKLGAMPQAADALAHGQISIEHADTLARVAERTSPEHVDADLVEPAEAAPADLFAKRASSWAGKHESTAKAEARDATQRAERELVTWHVAAGTAEHLDGSAVPAGWRPTRGGCRGS